MKDSKIQLETALSDQRKLVGYHYVNDEPKFVVLFVHGMGEHFHRYDEIARHFQQSGAACLGYDLPGFGKSEGKRGHAPSIEAFYETVDIAKKQLMDLYPQVPMVLYGHSMGGNTVLSYILRHDPSDFAAVISSSPWIRLPDPTPALRVMLAKMMNVIWPAYTENTGIDPHLVSKDEETVKAYIADPLVHGFVSASTGLSMTLAAEFLDTYKGGMPIPCLLMHGDHDSVTECQATIDFYNRNTENTTLKIWEGRFHETHNDRPRVPVFDYSLNWINNSINK